MRTSSAVTSTAAAVAAFSGLASAFTASAKTNVVTYWGQGPNQGSLQDVCKNPNVDIVNIGFINVFPDQGAGGWPGSNFGNACGSETYTYNGTKTQLLSHCPDIGPDIAICQQLYGKKVLLSIGGGYPTNYFIKNNASAVNFAEFLWGAFGPVTSEWTSNGGPRPFGTAVVDGFDFDIESELSSAPVVDGKTLTNYKTNGYVEMITTFKNTLYPQDSMKPYYISGAPQCVVPDAHFAGVVENAWFDFLFVQYYNTAACSARQAISSGTFKGYNDWTGVQSRNADLKLYVGLPGSTAASNDASYYLQPSEVKTLISKVYSNTRFGGIMVWESTYAANNSICNRNYLTWMKQILTAQADGTSLNTTTNPCPAAPISKDGTCGGYNGYTCAGSAFGSCCSQYGYCGSTSDYCNTANCQSEFGKCGTQLSSSSSKNISSSTSQILSSTSKRISSSSSKNASSTSTQYATVSRAANFGAGQNKSTLLVGTAPASAIIAPLGTGIAAAAGTGGLIGTVGLIGTSGLIGTGATVVAPHSIHGTAPVSAAKVLPSAGFPQVAPYSNSTAGKFGNAAANVDNGSGAGSVQIIDTTVLVTRTFYQTEIQQSTGTNAQGAETTEFVTKTVDQYVTVTAVATQVAVPESGNSDPSESVVIIDTTVLVTRTFYQTQIQPVTRTNAQGAATTEYVTKTINQYTTVTAVPTQIAALDSGNSDPSDPSESVQIIDTTIFVTRTFYQTQVQPMTHTNSQGAVTTEYVTQTLSVYTTVTPVATQIATLKNSSSGNSSDSSNSTVADQSGNTSNDDTMPNAGHDPRYSAVTQTVYSTLFVTATVRESVVTYTTSYPISTIINYAPTNTNSMTTTTTTVKSTKTFTETVRVGGSAAPFAFNNATANIFAPSGTAIVNAAYTPVSVQSSGSAPAASSSSASHVIVYQTQTVVAVAQKTGTASLEIAAAGSTAGTTSNSRIYGSSSNTTAYERSVMQMEMKAVAQGAADNVHTDIGLCVLALFIGAFFVI